MNLKRIGASFTANESARKTFVYSRLSVLIGAEVGANVPTTIDNELENSNVLIKNKNNLCAQTTSHNFSGLFVIGRVQLLRKNSFFYVFESPIVMDLFKL